MEFNRYDNTHGQTVLAATDLTYALTLNNKLDMGSLTAEDLSEIITLNDAYSAEVLAEALSDAKWLSVKEALENPCGKEQRSIKNYIVADDSAIYIRDGRKYLLLDTFLANASREALQEATRKTMFWHDVAKVNVGDYPAYSKANCSPPSFAPATYTRIMDQFRTSLQP